MGAGIEAHGMGVCRTTAFQVGFRGSCIVIKPVWGQRRLGGSEDVLSILVTGAFGERALCSASSKAGTAVCLSTVWQSTFCPLVIAYLILPSVGQD